MQATIDINHVLSSLDWIVFFVVLFTTLLSVVYGHLIKSKTVHSEKENILDLLLMGRKLTLPLFVATLVATWYGGIFGVTKIAFEQGIFNFLTQGVFWYAAYIIFAIFLVDKIAPYKALTLPDLIGKMFGPKSEKLSACFNFFNVLPIAYTISLGIFLQMIFGGSLVSMMILGLLVVTIYSAFGGFRAVIFSDLAQFFVMCLGVFLVIVFSYKSFGGIEYLKQSLPDHYFSFTGKGTWFSTFVWGFIALSTLVDPNFYQRCFAAKEKTVAKKGILISTCVWVIFDLCTTFGAMYAKATIPEAAADKGYLIYAIQLLPDGLRGFFLAGILATILSTLDSYLFLAGTTLSYDLLKNKFKFQGLTHHLGILLTSIISIILAVTFDGNIKTVWKTLGSYSASCLLLPVIIGHMFPKRISDKNFCIACLLGVVTVTIWRNVDRSGVWAQIDEIYIGILTTFLSISISSLAPRSKCKSG